MDFLSLESYILPPIPRLLISLFFPLGILGLAHTILKYFKEQEDSKNLLFYFLTTLTTYNVLTFTLCKTFGVSTSYLRFISILFLLNGLVVVFKYGRTSLNSLKAKATQYPLPFSILTLFLILSFAPATDADSLGYHLATPLYFLNTGLVEYIPAMNHMMLFAMPEVINLIGISAGSDCISAVIQMFILILLVLAILKECPQEKNNKEILLLLILTPFFLLFLISSQKGQLIGVWSLILSYLFSRDSRDAWQIKATILIFIAFSIKISFYLTGGVLLLYYFFLSKKKLRFFGLSVLLYSVIILPLHWFHYENTGTPIPPFLAFIIPDHDLLQILAEFKSNLKSYKEGFGFPLGLIIPKGLGNLTTTFGPVLVIPFFFISKKLKNKDTWLILSLTFLSLLLAQLTSRFFYLHFLLFSIHIFWSSTFKIYRPLALVLKGQSLVLILILIYANYSLTKGALTTKLRKTTLIQNSYMFEQFGWANEILPHEAIVFNSLRPKIYLARKWVSNDFSLYAKHTPKQIAHILSSSKDSKIFLLTSLKKPNDNLFGNLSSIKTYRSKKFKTRTRNPFNEGEDLEEFFLLSIDKNELLENLFKRI